MSRLRQTFASTRALLYFFVLNLFLQFGFYAVEMNSQLRVVTNKLSLFERSLFLTNVSTILLFVACAITLLSLILFAIFRTQLPQKLFILSFVLLEGLLLGLFYVDMKVYKILGVHIDNYFIWKGISSGGLKKEIGLNFDTILTFAFGVLAVYLLQSLLWVGSKWLSKKQGEKLAYITPTLLVLLLVGATTTYFISKQQRVEARTQQVMAIEAVPFWNLFKAKQKGSQGSLKERYPRIKKQQLPTLTRKKNVIFMLAESFRSDMLEPKFTPKLNEYMNKNSCIRSSHHHSGGNSTSWGTFSFLYGNYAYNFLPFHKKNIQSIPLRILKKNGYLIAGASAANFKGWDHIDFALAQFKPYKEFYEHDSYKKDQEMIKYVEEFNRTRDKSKPFFLFLFFYATHHNYYFPKKFKRFTPIMPENYNHFMSSRRLRKSKNKIFNRYKNSVAYVDHLFGKVMDIFSEERKKDDLVVLFSGDHGEEFWDHGLLGHGATRCINARTQVPLVYCLPKIKNKKVHLSSHADVMPTLLDYLGTKPKLPLKKYFDGYSLLKSMPKDRYVFVTGPGFPQKNPKACYIDQNHKYWLRRSTAFNKFEVTKYSDLEDNALSASQIKNKKKKLKSLGRDMRKFLYVRNAISKKEPKVQFRVDARFGEYIRLVGYDLKYDKLKTGQTFIVTYTFQTLKKIPPRWKLFFHLHIKNPNQFVNLDHVPVEGTYPLHKWKVGEYIQDEQLVWIPNYYKKGKSLSITLGMWARGKGRKAIKLDRYKFLITNKSLQLFKKKMD